MGKQKYDYSNLKLEFFESEHDEVKSFILGKGLVYNSGWQENTAGWTKEKKERKEKIVEKALARKQDELAKKLEIPMEYLLETKKATIQLMRKKLKYISELENLGSINLDDLEKIWRVAKTELGEPTSVAKNENNNKDTIQSISIVVGPQHIDKIEKND